MPKLSLRARAALYYFANSDMSISADRLAEEVLENRKAILTAPWRSGSYQFRFGAR